MKISEFRKILKAIDECDAVEKSVSLYRGTSEEMSVCLQGAVIARRHNLVERLKMAGVSIDEVV